VYVRKLLASVPLLLTLPISIISPDNTVKKLKADTNYYCVKLIDCASEVIRVVSFSVHAWGMQLQHAFAFYLPRWIAASSFIIPAATT